MNKLPYNTLEEVITSGGDERIELKENDFNQYYVNPVHYDQVINRGTCTCSPLTPEAYSRVNQVWESLKNGETTFEEVRAQHTRKLKKLINFKGEDKCEIFYAPSGSNLCYYQILFSKLVNPDKPIMNILTCPEELGTGSIIAASGNYFFTNSQFGDKVEKNAPISDHITVDKIPFPARDIDGRIMDHRQAILKAINKHNSDYSIVANLVIGSKSGIEDNVTIIPRAPKEVLWVVDICQARVSKQLVNKLLDLNCMVMITGSKFYQSPPFSGALIVPKNIVERFQEVEVEVLDAFKNIFSKYDFPAHLDTLSSHFRGYKNYGLLLRWEAAIYEMVQMSRLDIKDVLAAVNKWNLFIREQLRAYGDRFQLMPDQEVTNKTIISFQIKAADGRYLNDEELRKVYEAVTLSEHTGLKNANKIILGQPVKYTNRSFIRLALGTYAIRKFLTNSFDFENDKIIVAAINGAAKKLF